MVPEFRGDARRLTHLVYYRIASGVDSLDEASERIMKAVRSLPCAQGNLDDISLALFEALANAVVHGNREDSTKHVDVCATCQGPDLFTLVVTDEGEGFDPCLVPDPTVAQHLMSNHGRGLFLIRKLMDQTDIHLGGRQIVMTKTCRSAAGGQVKRDDKEL